MDIEDVINPPVRSAHKEKMRRRKSEDDAEVIGLHIGDIDEKLKSQLFMALGKNDKNILHLKSAVKIFDIIFS